MPQHYGLSKALNKYAQKAKTIVTCTLARLESFSTTVLICSIDHDSRTVWTMETESQGQAQGAGRGEEGEGWQ